MFVGKVRNINTTSDNLTLGVEDVSQENLHRDLPISMTDDSDQYPDKDKNKPFPMVYGHVDRSPTIKTVTIEDDNETSISSVIASKLPCYSIVDNWDTDSESVPMGDTYELYVSPLFVNNSGKYLNLYPNNAPNLHGFPGTHNNFIKYDERGFQFLSSGDENSPSDSDNNQGRVFLKEKLLILGLFHQMKLGKMNI